QPSVLTYFRQSVLQTRGAEEVQPLRMHVRLLREVRDAAGRQIGTVPREGDMTATLRPQVVRVAPAPSEQLRIPRKRLMLVARTPQMPRHPSGRVVVSHGSQRQHRAKGIA